MEVQKYGLICNITTLLTYNSVLAILISFRERFESFELTGGNNDEDGELKNYVVKFYFKKEQFTVINSPYNWLRVRDDFLKSLILVENIFTLKPNKEL